MITTTYKCDKCGEKVGADVLKGIALHVNQVSYSTPITTGQGASFPKIKAHWCVHCLKRAGLVPILNNDPNPVEVKKPSFEDLVSEIVQYHLENYQ